MIKMNAEHELLYSKTDSQILFRIWYMKYHHYFISTEYVVAVLVHTGSAARFNPFLFYFTEYVVAVLVHLVLRLSFTCIQLFHRIRRGCFGAPSSATIFYMYSIYFHRIRRGYFGAPWFCDYLLHVFNYFTEYVVAVPPSSATIFYMYSIYFHRIRRGYFGAPWFCHCF